MNRKIKLFLFVVIVFAFSTYCTKGQTLSLDDIFNARAMDSVELMSFGYEKGFELEEIDIDIWRTVHKYYSLTDNSIWFERNFPTGRKLSQDTTTRDDRVVFYHFADKETLNEFKEKMKEKGFKFKRTDTKEYGGNKFIHNIYLTTDNEIDLVSEKPLGQKAKYTLMYYGRIN